MKHESWIQFVRANLSLYELVAFQGRVFVYLFSNLA